MVTDDMVEKACRANIHPDSDRSDTKRRKMRAALEDALSAAEPVAWRIVGKFDSGSTTWKVVQHEHQAHEEAKSWEKMCAVEVHPLYAAPPAPSVAVKELPYHCDVCTVPGYGDAPCSPLCDRSALSAQVQDVAVEDVLSERKRQVEREGWTPEHDDAYTEYELAWAAITYAMAACADSAERAVMDQFGDHSATPGRINENWPWDWKWWKPKDRRRDLVRAAALIIAEIERLDRAAAPAKQEGGE